MKWSNYLEINRLLGAAAFVGLYGLLLAGCTTSVSTISTPENRLSPTASPTIIVRTISAAETPAPPTLPVSRDDASSPDQEADAEQQWIDVTATPESVAASEGIRPADAILQRNPENGLESPVDWRPPPIPVPHALHPDDHYWLARPIPSDRRNYDLEWYPYGNRPMRTQAPDLIRIATYWLDQKIDLRGRYTRIGKTVHGDLAVTGL